MKQRKFENTTRDQKLPKTINLVPEQKHVSNVHSWKQIQVKHITRNTRTTVKNSKCVIKKNVENLKVKRYEAR